MEPLRTTQQPMVLTLNRRASVVIQDANGSQDPADAAGRWRESPRAYAEVTQERVCGTPGAD